MKKPLWILLITALITGCYYDNEERLYPKLDQVCDTVGVAFAKTILPILQTNCYGCHSTTENANSGGSINLEDFTILKQLVDLGKVYGSIVQDPSGKPMPKGGVKLDTCSITKIKIWIDHGAINN